MYAKICIYIHYVNIVKKSPEKNIGIGNYYNDEH